MEVPGVGAAPARPWWLVPVSVLDRVLSVVVALALTVEAITVPGHAWQGYLVLAVSVAAFIAVRPAPAASLAMAAAAPVLAVLLDLDPLQAWNPAVFIAFLLALRGFPAVLAGGVVGVVNFGSQGLFLHGVGLEQNPIAYAAGFAAFAAAAVGSALRNQHRYWAALEEYTREAVANRVVEERLRIARDLHDSVGHAVAVVSMRLGAAEVQLPAAAEGARGELEAARLGVQDVLRETQQILRVLRVDPGNPEVTADVTGLPDLVSGFRRAGVEVLADLGGFSATLPVPTSTAVYRIVQEALTNAGRHGHGPVRLRVVEQQDSVLVSVVNRVGVAQPGGGHGLVGMRERAASAGGLLEVRQEDGEFGVRAELPLDGGFPR